MLKVRWERPRGGKVVALGNLLCRTALFLNLASVLIKMSGFIANYYQTKELPTNIRCKAYTKPPRCGDGVYITTISPGTYLGPVENYDVTAEYATILVRGYWINVRYCGVKFADKVPDATVQGWYRMGWRH